LVSTGQETLRSGGVVSPHSPTTNHEVTVSHYRSNVRDLRFVLLEVLRIDRNLGSPAFPESTVENVNDLLAQLAKLAETVLADSLVDGDRNPPVLDPADGTVRIPETVKKAVAALVRDGWDSLHLPVELGGDGLPPSVAWACAELILGANPVLYFYTGGKIAAQVVHKNGTVDQQRWARWMIQRDWSATMVLTEPDVGSDVGSVRTKAIPQADGSWHIEGVKRFITAAAQDDMTENIVHLVLARPSGPDTKPGTKGLGLFIVPALHVDRESGEPTGERNGVAVTKIEDKMGIKAATTCELLFGGDSPAVGWLLGEDVRGISQIFDLIGHARLMVGTKAVATLSSAYLTAADYARTRMQGGDLARLLDRDAPKVAIIDHADVRRSLMLQKSYVEGMRSLYLYTAAQLDECLIDPAGSDVARRVHEFLLPVVKGACGERAWSLLAESLQVLGGSGYLRDYPIEQYLRDGKIDTLYEGTTAIQALDFFFRKIVRDGGIALEYLLGEITRFSTTAQERLGAETAALAEGVEHLRAMVAAMTGYLAQAASEPTVIHRVGGHAVPLLSSTADLLVGWRLAVGAHVAVTALDAGGLSEQERDFYTGKAAASAFFAAAVLPHLATARRVIENADDQLAALPGGAF
jgi:alkylation response protein AidB-like acyl-CoA dehydrogenase